MENFQALEPRAERVGFAVFPLLPGHPNFRASDQQRRQILPLDFKCGATIRQAELRPHRLVEEHAFAPLSRQMAGVGAGNNHPVETAQATGREVGEHHRTGDAVVAKNRLFKLLIEPLPPLGISERSGIVDQFVTQLLQQLEQLLPGRIALQAGTDLQYLQAGEQALQPLGQRADFPFFQQFLRLGQGLKQLDDFFLFPRQGTVTIEVRHHAMLADQLFQPEHPMTPPCRVPAGKNEGGFEQVEQILVMKAAVQIVQPAHHHRAGAGGGKGPAGFVRHQHRRPLQQGTRAPRHEPVLGHHGDGGFALCQPLADAEGDCFGLLLQTVSAME
jgi:hypothetical protein